MGREVPKTNTPVSDAQMAQAIINVWRRMFGTTPSREQVYLIMAQNSLETGPKRASMHNYNVGNIIVGGIDHDYFLGGDWMYADKSETQKKQITQHFRAYDSLEDGVEDYLKLLSQSHRYATAWQHIMKPDIQAYSEALHEAGYYGEKADKYTAGLMGQFNKFNKGDSYSAGLAGQAPESGTMVATTTPAPKGTLDSFLNKFIEMLSAATAPEVSLKKAYKQSLPNHNILIQINAPDHTSAVEFSRVLCTALDEDLLSTSYPHTDGELVEIECSIAGPPKECLAAVKQMTDAVAEAFQDATTKIGGIRVKNNVFMNKKSSYQPITPRTASTNYRKFLLKFV
jgi:hypothetical protein